MKKNLVTIKVTQNLHSNLKRLIWELQTKEKKAFTLYEVIEWLLKKAEKNSELPTPINHEVSNYTKTSEVTA